jgi:hypothetical protein
LYTVGFRHRGPRGAAAIKIAVMAETPIDPLLLGQRVVAILETGLRTATYKLATLTALIDQCIEHLPDTPDAPLTVPIPDLAHRVLEIYWRQVRPFDCHELRQSTQPRARILAAAIAFRHAAGAGHGGSALEAAMVRAPQAYRATLDEVTLCLAQQPLHRLQRLPGGTGSDSLLYDDTFLHDHISRATLSAHGDAIELKPGVAHALARLAGLLKPALEIMWVDDVRRMNKFLGDDVPDVTGHLFGRERISLAAVQEPFKDVFGARCFYCAADLRSGSPIDHVLPWSLWGSTVWPTWCWPALGATGTSVTRCPRWRSSTGCSDAIATFWNGSPPRLAGPPNTSG